MEGDNKFILTKGLKRFINNLVQNFVLNQDDAVNKNKILQVQSNGAINLSNFDIIKDVDITTATPEDNTNILYRDVNDGKLYFYKNNSFIQISGDSLIYCTELPTENINSKVIYAKHYNENKNVEYLIYDTVLEKWISIYNDANIFLQPKDIQNEKLNSNNFYYIWGDTDERFFCWVASAYEGHPKLYTKTLTEGTDIDAWEIVFNDNGKPTSITKIEQKCTIEKINNTLRLRDAENKLYDRLVRLDGFYTTEENTIFMGTTEAEEVEYVQVFKITYNKDRKQTISIEDLSFDFEIIKENDELVLQKKTGDREKFVRLSSLDGYYIAGKSIVGLGMLQSIIDEAGKVMDVKLGDKSVVKDKVATIQTIDNVEDNFYYAFKNGSTYRYTKSKAVGSTACYQFTYTDNVLTKIENIGNITIYLNADTIPEFTIGTTKYTLDATKNDYYIIDPKQKLPSVENETRDFTTNDLNRIFEDFYETPQNNDWKYVGILGGSVGSTLTVNDDWSELLFVARLQENSAYYNDGKIIPKAVFTTGSPTNNNVFVGFYWNDNYTYKSRIGLYGSGTNRYIKNDYPRSDMWTITGFYIYKR